jgi:Holliday junction resolvase-like predicted endonuclease
MQLLPNERTTRLGRLGEELAAERLKANGFSHVTDLNAGQPKNAYGDILATRDGRRFLISVKTRNEMRQGGAKRNESYNLVQIRHSRNAELKRQGKDPNEVTRMLLREVVDLAKSRDAEPAWVVVTVRPKAATYSAYFGVLSELGKKRSVPMTVDALRNYECLARGLVDAQITPDLLNN